MSPNPIISTISQVFQAYIFLAHLPIPPHDDPWGKLTLPGAGMKGEAGPWSPWFLWQSLCHPPGPRSSPEGLSAESGQSRSALSSLGLARPCRLSPTQALPGFIDPLRSGCVSLWISILGGSPNNFISRVCSQQSCPVHLAVTTESFHRSVLPATASKSARAVS